MTLLALCSILLPQNIEYSDDCSQAFDWSECLNKQKKQFHFCFFILFCQLSHPYLEILNDSLLQNIFSKNHFSTKYFLMLDWELNVESFFLSTNGDYSRIIFRKETLKNSTNRKKESYQEFLEFNMVNFSLFFQKFLQSLIHLQKIK